MDTQESGFFALLKSALFKGFFCLGVVSALSLAYSRLASSQMDHKLVERSLIDEKVVELVKSPELRDDLNRVVEAQTETVEPVIAVVKASSELTGVVADAAAAPATLADASPSPTPAEPTAEAANSPNPEDGNGGTPTVEFSQNANAPYQYGNPYVQNPEPQAQDAQTDSSNPSTPSAANAGTNAPYVGFVPSNYFNHNQNASNSGVPTTGSGAVTSAGVEQSSLTASDLPLLTSAMRGIFAGRTENISGTLCSDGQVGGSSCMKEPHYQIHTSRWNQTNGLSTEVGFSVSGVSTSALQANLTLKIQNAQAVISAATGTTPVASIGVVNENRNSRKYRVFTLHLPAFSVGADKLESAQVTLVFDTTSGPGIITSDSSLIFNRKSVQTTPSAWDASVAARTPAVNEPVIVADQVQYSITLEK